MRVGLITIGQSPRIDLEIDFEKYLKDIDYEVIGVLDKYSDSEIYNEFHPKPGENYYVTSLRNGLWIKVSVSKIIEETQIVINKIESDFDIIALLCTGYMNIYSKKILVNPDILIKNIVISLGIGRIGVIFPTIDQINMVLNKWRSVGLETIATHYNPYSEDLVLLSSRVSVLKNCDLIVMDCIGYSSLHRDIVRKIFDKPIILPRTLLLSFIRELIGV